MRKNEEDYRNYRSDWKNRLLHPFLPEKAPMGVEAHDNLEKERKGLKDATKKEDDKQAAYQKMNAARGLGRGGRRRKGVEYTSADLGVIAAQQKDAAARIAADKAAAAAAAKKAGYVSREDAIRMAQQGALNDAGVSQQVALLAPQGGSHHERCACGGALPSAEFMGEVLRKYKGGMGACQSAPPVAEAPEPVRVNARRRRAAQRRQRAAAAAAARAALLAPAAVMGDPQPAVAAPRPRGMTGDPELGSGMIQSTRRVAPAPIERPGARTRRLRREAAAAMGLPPEEGRSVIAELREAREARQAAALERYRAAQIQVNIHRQALRRAQQRFADILDTGVPGDPGGVGFFVEEEA